MAYTDQLTNLQNKIVSSLEGLPDLDLTKRSNVESQLALLYYISNIINTNGAGTIILAVFKATTGGTGYSTNDIIVLQQTAPAAPIYFNGTTNAVIATPNPAHLGSISSASNVTVATALPAGTNAIGSITNTAFGISGTLPAFASTPVVTANAGTNLNTSTLALEGTQSTINTKTPALGQALAAASSPVVLTAIQMTALTPPAAITGFALDGTNITTPFAMPAGGTGLLGWLSAIWTRLNASLVARSTCFFPSQTVQRAANVTAYTANDQYGATLTLTGAGTASSACYLTDLRIVLALSVLPAGMGAGLVYLYNVTPPSARADNDPFSLPAGDRASCLTPNGIAVTFSLVTGASSSVVAVANNINRLLQIPASGNLFGCIVTNTPFTPAANSETGTIHLSLIEA